MKELWLETQTKKDTEALVNQYVDVVIEDDKARLSESASKVMGLAE